MVSSEPMRMSGPMSHRTLALMLLTVLGTGCPDNWRKGGAMDMAMEKDREEEWRLLRQQMNCQMPREEWMQWCDNSEGPPSLANCPKNCRSRN